MHHFHLKNKFKKLWGGAPLLLHVGGVTPSPDPTPDLAPSIENFWVRPCRK